MKSEDLALLAEQSRKRTIKKLKEIPDGLENWRLNRKTPSFAEITQHLLEIDNVLLHLQETGFFKWKKGKIDPSKQYTTEEFKAIFEQLAAVGEQRRQMIASLTKEDLERKVVNKDKGEMSMEWFIMKNIIQHETYHSGQLSANIKMFKEEFSI